MKKLLIIGLLFCTLALSAQDNQRTSGLSVYVGAGPNFYINNFDLNRERVDGKNYSISARILWEPEYRVSIGLKTGYYWVYRVNFPARDVQITLTAVPIQPLMRMQLTPHLYGSLGLGPTVYFNSATQGGQEVLNHTFVSLADVSVGFGYMKRRPGKISYGAELEYFRSSKSDEHVINVLFMVRLPFGGR